ncbi:MAG: protein kinase [Deltaproteobacteria bacterium]|nr:protein kinase [Deltaproteobacteria bacterium]
MDLRLEAGSVVASRFVLQRKLGSGSFATVWAAEDRALDSELVALKVLHPQAGRKRTAIERFEREIEILTQLDHPAIVRAIWWSATESLPLLAMELVRGITLEQELRRRSVAEQPLDVEEICAICAVLFSAIAHAHERGVVHRDLKPKNLMLADDARCRLKVLDFGIARLAGRDAADATTLGRALGSLLYMSPEQLRGDEVDARTDIFALGCVVFELLTLARAWAIDERGAHLPFRAGAVPATSQNNYSTIVERITQGRRPRVSEARPGSSRALDEIVARALAVHPQDRFLSVRELQDALLGELGEVDANEATRVLTRLERQAKARLEGADLASEQADRERKKPRSVEPPAASRSVEPPLAPHSVEPPLAPHSVEHLPARRRAEAPSPPRRRAQDRASLFLLVALGVVLAAGAVWVARLPASRVPPPSSQARSPKAPPATLPLAEVRAAKTSTVSPQVSAALPPASEPEGAASARASARASRGRSVPRRRSPPRAGGGLSPEARPESPPGPTATQETPRATAHETPRANAEPPRSAGVTLEDVARISSGILRECESSCADDIAAHADYPTLLRKMARLPDADGRVGAALFLLQTRPVSTTKLRAVLRDLTSAPR